MEKLYLKQFTYEAGLVMIDFLIRHGIITAENYPDYLNVCDNLRLKIELPGP